MAYRSKLSSDSQSGRRSSVNMPKRKISPSSRSSKARSRKTPVQAKQRRCRQAEHQGQTSSDVTESCQSMETAQKAQVKQSELCQQKQTECGAVVMSQQMESLYENKCEMDGSLLGLPWSACNEVEVKQEVPDPLFGIKKEVEDSDHEFSHFVVNGDHCQHVDPFVKLEDESSPIECALSVSQIVEHNSLETTQMFEASDKDHGHSSHHNSFSQVPEAKLFTQRTSPRMYTTFTNQELDNWKLSCTKCRLIFSTEAELAEHTHFRIKIPRAVTCDLCGAICSGKTQLRKHMSTHTAERRFPCTDCDKTFKHKGDLQTHSNAHRISKVQKSLSLYSCGICQEIFSDEKHLDEHLVHSHSRCYT